MPDLKPFDIEKEKERIRRVTIEPPVLSAPKRDRQGKLPAFVLDMLAKDLDAGTEDYSKLSESARAQLRDYGYVYKEKAPVAAQAPAQAPDSPSAAVQAPVAQSSSTGPISNLKGMLGDEYSIPKEEDVAAPPWRSALGAVNRFGEELVKGAHLENAVKRYGQLKGLKELTPEYRADMDTPFAKGAGTAGRFVGEVLPWVAAGAASGGVVPAIGAVGAGGLGATTGLQAIGNIAARGALTGLGHAAYESVMAPPAEKPDIRGVNKDVLTGLGFEFGGSAAGKVIPETWAPIASRPLRGASAGVVGTGATYPLLNEEERRDFGKQLLHTGGTLAATDIALAMLGARGAAFKPVRAAGYPELPPVPRVKEATAESEIGMPSVFTAGAGKEAPVNAGPPAVRDVRSGGSVQTRKFGPEQAADVRNELYKAAGPEGTGVPQVGKQETSGGKVYFRSTNSKTPMSKWGHALFADNPERTIVYGENLYQYNDKGSVPITRLSKQIEKAWNEEREDGFSSDLFSDSEKKYWENVSTKDVVESFNPKDIVNSAEAWDDGTLFTWVYERILEPNDITAVTTKNGAIVFDEALIKKATEGAVVDVQALPGGKVEVSEKVGESAAGGEVKESASTKAPETTREIALDIGSEFRRAYKELEDSYAAKMGDEGRGNNISVFEIRDRLAQNTGVSPKKAERMISEYLVENKESLRDLGIDIQGPSHGAKTIPLAQRVSGHDVVSTIRVSEPARKPEIKQETRGGEEKLITIWDKLEREAMERIKSRKGRLMSGLPLDDLMDYSIVGAAKIARGAVKFQTWSTEMVKEFGERIRPHLGQIWDKSNNIYEPASSGNELLGEGSISAAKKVIPDKNAPTGNENEYVQSFNVSALESPGIEQGVKDILWWDVQPGETGTYQRRGHKMLSEKAERLIAENPEAAYRHITSDEVLLKEPDLTVAAGIKLADHYQKQGNFHAADEILNYTADHLTRAGQTVNAAKLINKLSPAGVVMRGKNEAGKAFDGLPERDKKRHRESSDELQKGFEEINEETVDEIINQSDVLDKAKKKKIDTGAKDKPKQEFDPAAALADRVKQYVSDKKSGDTDAERLMVRTLFAKAKEVIAKDVKDTAKLSELDKVVEAINKNEAYRKTWDESKGILLEKYGEIPQIMLDVEVYIEHYLNVPYSERSVDLILRKAIKKKGFNLEKSAFGPMSPTFESESANGLVKQIIADSGLKGQGAETLAMELGTKLDGMLKDKRDAKTAKLADRIIDMVTKDKQPLADNPVRDMFSTLLQKAKESLPKTDSAKASKDPALDLYNALNNRKMFDKVWAETKQALAKKLEAKGIKVADVNLDFLFAELLYHPYSQAQLRRTVKAGIKDYGIEIDKIVRQHFTVQDMSGKTLAQKLVDRGMLNETEAAILSQDIQKLFDAMATKRKGEILDQIFKQRATVKRKSIDQRIIELSNLGALTQEKYRGLVAEKLGLPVLTAEGARGLRDIAEQLQMIPDGRQKDVLLARLNTILSSFKIPGNIQKIKALRRAAMLLNTVTMIRSVGGNVGLGVLENIKDIPGSIADVATSAVRKSARTTLAPSLEGIKTQGKGLVEGVSLVTDDIREGVNTSATRGIYEIPEGRTFKNPVFNALDAATTRALQYTDQPFYQAAYREALRQQMKIHKVTEPTQEMKDFAVEVAKDRTFQNDSEISKAVIYLRRGVNSLGEGIIKIGTKELGIGDVAVPFAKTLGNIMDKTIDYSPVGFVKAGREAYRGSRNGDFNQKMFVDAIGRAVTGSALILLGYDLARLGIITGPVEKVKSYAGFLKGIGQREYSYNMSAAIRLIKGQNPKVQKGDVIRTYDFAQPASVTLAVGSVIYSSIKNRKKAANMILEATKTAGNTMMRMSVAQGIQKMFGGYDVTQNFLNTVLQAPLQMIPTISGQIAKVSDKKARETYDPDAAAAALNRVKAKIPGVGRKLPVRVDTLGRDVESVPGGGSVWNSMFNPGITEKYNPTNVEKMILDVYEKTGDTSIFPRVAPKSFKVKRLNGKDEPIDIELTGKEFSKFQRIMGRRTNEEFAKIPAGMKPEFAVKRMEAILKASTRFAKKQILKERGYSVMERDGDVAVR